MSSQCNGYDDYELGGGGGGGGSASNSTSRSRIHGALDPVDVDDGHQCCSNRGLGPLPLSMTG